MAKVYSKLIVDVHKETTNIITAVQNDAQSRYLDVVLTANSQPIDLTGHEVRIYGKKADGKEIYNNGEITEATNGRCQFELTDQALAVAHDLEVQIVIYKDNVEILQALPFKIHVVKSLVSTAAVESSNEYGALVVLYQNLYEAYDLMTEMVQNIGKPGETAKELELATMWDAWENMSVQLKEALENSSIEGVIKKLGSATDETTAGTVMGKENAIIKQVQDMSDTVMDSMDQSKLVLSAKILCKGVVGTKFTIKNRERLRGDIIVTLTDQDIMLSVGLYMSIVLVPTGYHDVEIELDGLTYSSAVNVDTVGKSYTASYTNYVKLETITSSKTFKVPNDVYWIYVTGIGGGGGGGGSLAMADSGSSGGGGGGGKGASTVKTRLNVTPGETLQITVGTGGGSSTAGTATLIGTKLTLRGGGAGGTATNSAGTDGGDSGGGRGGGYSSGGSSGVSPNGGYGGAESIGDEGGGGGGGGGGIDINGEATAAARGGKGGDGKYNTWNNGEAGNLYGSGGGGGGGSKMASGSSSGGRGSNGLVIIYKGVVV